MNLPTKFVQILCLSFLSFTGIAQSDSSSLKPKAPVIFRDKAKKIPSTSDFTASFVFGTSGWNFGLNLIQSVPGTSEPRISRVFGVGFGYFKHPKEQTTVGLYVDPRGQTQVSQVRFGKMNSLFPITLTYGQRREIGVPAIYDGVEVLWEYKVGALLGWLLPYQIEGVVNGSSGRLVSYDSYTKAAYENPEFIIKGYGALSNIQYSKIIPGARLASGLVFNYSKKQTWITALTFGGTLDIYSQSLPIFWSGNSSSFVAQLYAGMEFGRRKTK